MASVRHANDFKTGIFPKMLCSKVMATFGCHSLLLRLAHIMLKYMPILFQHSHKPFNKSAYYACTEAQQKSFPIQYQNVRQEIFFALWAGVADFGSPVPLPNDCLHPRRRLQCTLHFLVKSDRRGTHNWFRSIATVSSNAKYFRLFLHNAWSSYLPIIPVLCPA